MTHDELADPGPPGEPPRAPAADEAEPPEAIPRSRLDQDALRVISRLQRNDYEAYLVGGCVRDLLIGRIPKDFDVATSAHPRQIKRLFHNARIIGRRFRLAHITYGGHVVETATFRRDPDLSAPEEGAEEGSDAAESTPEDLLITQDNVFGTAEQDARRRDFTINALFYDPTRSVIHDYVGGLADLEGGVLRTIGDPHVRMAEDPVRILRAVKFATRLSFRIDERTWEAMSALAPQLARAAPPRVLEEVLRLLRSGTALGAMRMLRACGALKIVLPEVDRYLGERDDSGAGERADRLWRLLEALDNDVHGGFVPTTPVCLAILYLRIIEQDVDLTAAAGPGTLGRRRDGRARPRARRAELADRPPRLHARGADHRPAAAVHAARLAPLPAAALRALRGVPRGARPLPPAFGGLGQGWDLYEGWRARASSRGRRRPDEIESERRAARRRPRRRRRRRGCPASAAGDPSTGESRAAPPEGIP
jgi:poly(A) polymerase